MNISDDVSVCCSCLRVEECCSRNSEVCRDRITDCQEGGGNLLQQRRKLGPTLSNVKRGLMPLQDKTRKQLSFVGDVVVAEGVQVAGRNISLGHHASPARAKAGAVLLLTTPANQPHSTLLQTKQRLGGLGQGCLLGVQCCLNEK